MRAPFAEFRGPIPNQTVGGFERPAVGVVLHIMGSSYTAADNWFHNPKAQASAHFGVKLGGEIVQWVDTDDRAWHAAAANHHWYGIETEGASGPLSDAQLTACATIYRWLHLTEGVPYQTTEDPLNGHGFGWHGMGGAAWGGHDYCPGPERKAQRQRILDLAQGQDAPQEELMLIVASKTNVYLTNGQTKHTLPDGAAIQRWLAAGAKDARQVITTDDVDHIPLSDA